jgi:hypothetical protein
MRLTRLLLAAALGGAATSLLLRAARRTAPTLGLWDPHGQAADDRDEDDDATVNRDAGVVADDALAASPNAGEQLAPASRAASVLRRDDAHADLLASNSQDGAFATSSGLSDFTRGA